jgi:type IV pilus assembly protein PilW
MRRVRGFSLVELMVAITLALIVTAGVISVFVGSRSTYNATAGTAELTDGGRFALKFISDSLRSAGYLSCTTAPLVSQGTLNPPAPGALAYNFNKQLGGFEANNTGVGKAFAVVAPPVAADGNNADWTGGLDPLLTGLPLQNSDVLVVRSTVPNAQPAYVQTINPGANQFTVSNQASLQSGQLAVISDCAFGVVFQITGVAPGTPATITHNAGGGTPGNFTTIFPLDFSPGALVTPVDTFIYYIGVGADGDGALFVYSSNATGNFTLPQELVPDIEAMQVLYGIDTNTSNTVTQYLPANLVPDFDAVMSVKVALLAASAPGAGHHAIAGTTYNLLGTTVAVPADTRSRQVFEETIALRNALN